MRRFSGVGGTLYALGERLSFQTALTDLGFGWDYIAPEELSYWEGEPRILGDGQEIGLVECFPSTGRVGLARNMSRAVVVAIGSCRPISFLSESTRWEVTVEAAVPENTVLGQNHISTVAVIGGTTGVARGAEVPITEVLARFPVGDGMLVGVGEAKQVDSDVYLNFKEGVRYARR